MARRRAVEDPVSHERWLVSYADFITLLFAFFVVMYSISQVNEGKYKVLSQTLTEAFTSTQVDTGGNPPELTLDPFQVGDLAKSNPLNVIEMTAPVIKQNEGDRDAKQEGVITEQGGLPNDFEQLSNQVEQAFGDLADSDLISVRGNEEWLQVEMQSSLLFETGKAALNAEALELLGGIAELLKTGTNPIRVEGFTDNVPINTPQFPSNWELSTARAAAVVQLFTEEGIDPSRMAAIGYGEYQPVVPNDTPEGRARNRRVVLMIAKTGELRPTVGEPTDLQAVLRPVEEAAPQAAASPAGNTGIEIRIPGVNPPAAPDTPSPTPATPGDGGIRGVKTVELEGGGLLFTRENDQQDAPQAGGEGASGEE